MAERADELVTMNGGQVLGKIYCLVEGWRWRGGRVGDVIYEMYENQCVPDCEKCKACEETITYHFVKSVARFKHRDQCIAGVVAEGGNIARTWRFKSGVFEPYKGSWCPFVK